MSGESPYSPVEQSYPHTIACYAKLSPPKDILSHAMSPNHAPQLILLSCYESQSRFPAYTPLMLWVPIMLLSLYSSHAMSPNHASQLILLSCYESQSCSPAYTPLMLWVPIMLPSLYSSHAMSPNHAPQLILLSCYESQSCSPAYTPLMLWVPITRTQLRAMTQSKITYIIFKCTLKNYRSTYICISCRCFSILDGQKKQH